MIKVVKADKSHIARLVSIGKQNWPDEKWITAAYLDQTLKNKGPHFVALLEDRVIGGIMVSEEAHPRSWLFYFAVDKSHQRRGIGSLLLKKVESKMKKSSMLFTDLEKKDKKGLAFYMKHRFKIVGQVNGWYEGGRKSLVLAKKI